MIPGAQNASDASRDRARLRLTIRGAVQGVGFRPFVFRLATSLQLAGWVKNSPEGVLIEAEGTRARLEEFRERLPLEKPAISLMQTIESEWLAPRGEREFQIQHSETGGLKTALVLPDIATCPDCLREIFDPTNRRHRYPFTNCTHCGPRFSIIEALPYDRPHTTMKAFALCPQCRAEYENPSDRRFHAQPNACPACGPRLELWDAGGTPVLLASDPLRSAADALRAGRIVAVKGLGGFHLMVAAHLEESIRRLRALKHREEKPFALMVPMLEEIRRHCEVSKLEEQLLTSPQAPIVLLRRQASRFTSHVSRPTAHAVAPSVAPGNPWLGVMLPGTPLHHLLLRELGFAVVATSGNLSDEPICTDEHDAVRRLAGLADFFLVHNRPIARHVDDSVVRVVAGREMVLRRARGYAPLPVVLTATPPAALAVGAHLKNAIAVSVGPQVFLSQHIGDLETEEALGAFRRVIADLENFYEIRPEVVACDAHPDYLSTQFAKQAGLPLLPVQHHCAHVLSCLAENGATGDALGVSWDGTGLGDDGTIWGGEFLLVNESGCDRLAHLRTFRLPGGDAAVKEPRRAALGLLFAAFGADAFAMKHLAPIAAFSETELKALRQMLVRRVNSPVTSSAGRLFDAVAALVGLRQRVAFEGQAAMELEWAIEPALAEAGRVCSQRAADRSEQPNGALGTVAPHPAGLSSSPRSGQYEFQLIEFPSPASPIPAAATPPLVLDWQPLLEGILADLQAGVRVAEISRKFHDAMAGVIVDVARRAGRHSVALSGGCFQNLYLAEQSILRLRVGGFQPLWHQFVPPNDGGIALGQMAAVARRK